MSFSSYYLFEFSLMDLVGPSNWAEETLPLQVAMLLFQTSLLHFQVLVNLSTTSLAKVSLSKKWWLSQVVTSILV